MPYPVVTIDATKVANVLHRHPWIFSSVIVGKDDAVAHGSLVRIAEPSGKI